MLNLVVRKETARISKVNYLVNSKNYEQSDHHVEFLNIKPGGT
jgi:hypothetical protein